MVVELVIVGAGPAGCAAAIQFKRLGGRPLLFDQKGVPGGLLTNAYLVENYPGLKAPISGEEFARRLDAQLKSHNIRVRKGRLALLNNTPEGVFRLTDKSRVFEARALIVATGTCPKHLELEEKSEGTIKRLFYEVKDALEHRPRSAAVIGSGDAAFDYALSLAAAGAKVDLLVRSNKAKACNRLVKLVKNTPRIAVRYKRTVLNVSDTANGIRVAFSTGRSFEYDVCVVAVGRRSGASIFIGPAIPNARTGEGVRTNIPGLFLAGDARLGTLGQAGIAVGDGLECAAEAYRYLKEVKRSC